MNISGTDLLKKALKLIRHHVLLVVILLFVLTLGTYRLPESPLTGYDEGILNQMASNLVRHGALDLRTTPESFTSGAYMTTAYPVLFPVAIGMAIGGTTLESARLVMVLFMLGFVTAAYIVVYRSFGGRRDAALATALIATHASLFAYGKGLMGEIPGLFYLMLFLIGLERLSRKPERPLALVILTSLALGLTAVTKPVFLVILPAAAITALIHWKKLPVTPKTIIASILTLLATAAVWVGTQFSARDDFASVLHFYRNPYLLSDIWSVIVGNIVRFFSEGTPLYVAGLLAVWMIFLAWRGMDRSSEQRIPSPVETCALLFVILVLLAYLRTPGFYRYFFLANMVVLLAFPLALEKIIGRILHHFPAWKAGPTSRDLGTIACLLLVGFQAWQLFNRSYIITTYSSTQTAQLEQYFGSTFDRNRHAFLYDVPELGIFLPTQHYSQWIEVSGGGLFAVGYPLEDAINARIDTILLNEKRFHDEESKFTDYRVAAQVTRYIILERK